MYKVSVVALDISRRDEHKSSSFSTNSFDIQLQKIEVKIRGICNILATKNTEQWIIAWREYGLTNGLNNRYLTKDQKSQLKLTLSRITQDYPKLTIISGTVATERLIDPQKQPEKVSKIKLALKMNSLGSGRIVEQQRLKEIKSQSFFVIRNTAYVFSQGTCVARHDKTRPFLETLNFTPKDKVIFRPGVGKNQSSNINKCFCIEICREHGEGLMAGLVKADMEPVPLIQFILADGVMLIPKNCISPYAIFIDGLYPIRLITETAKNDADVSLYSCDGLSDDIRLKFIEPQTVKSYINSYLIQEIDDQHFISQTDIDSIVLDEKGNHLLSKEDYSELVALVSAKYADYTQSEYAKNIAYILLYLLPLCLSLEKDIIDKIIKTALENDHTEIINMMVSIGLKTQGVRLA